jgi:hypothetical protein
MKTEQYDSLSVVAAGLFCLRFGSLFKLSVSEGD